MKIKLNLDGKLPRNKTIKFASMIIVVRTSFLEINKYYSRVFLGECFYKF